MPGMLAILALGIAALIVSLVTTRLMIAVAPRLGFVDQPGGRKVHDNPKPLLGGVAVVIGMLVPLAIGYLGFVASDRDEHAANDYVPALMRGAVGQSRLAVVLAGGILLLHLVGLIDDRRALGPYSKLVVQFLAAAAIVIPFHDVRAMTFLDAHVGGPWLSTTLTIFWIVAITNAFNFLDNMDGLSAGVAIVCATALLVTTLTIGQWFVAATLAAFIGATLGFLVFNFPPSKIFMGDSGSMVLGYVLGVLTIRTTYLPPGKDFGAGWFSVFSPLIVLALPLYDLVVVSFIRLRMGKSPFVGDTNHFSHRLVRRGMSKRTAVLCLYLVAAATSIAAVVLPQVTSDLAAILILAQTVLILCLVALLEQHPLPPETT